MTRPNFFCGIEVLQWLLEHEPKSELDDIDLTVDLIEAPYLLFYSSDAEAWELKVMLRGELYDHKTGSGVEKGVLRVEKQSGEGTGSTSDEILRDNMGAFLEACRRLARYLRDAELQPVYDGLDPEEAGVLLSVDGEKLAARKVEGKERPELVCETLFGGTVKMRPYMEDFLERSMVDEMSIEEKIEAGEQGDKFAMAQLAGAYLNGDGEVEQDPERAAYWYRKEAELEDAEGAFNLGLLYAKGFGVERDFQQAAAWMERAVAWGNPDGAGPAELYRKMEENQKKAEAGDAAAMAELAGGYMSLGGSLDQAGAGADYAESLKWARKAADAGCAAGYWSLALAYEHGRGVAQDDGKAVEYYRQGAELDDANCQHSYGCRLMTGEGVKQDKKHAFALFKRSAEQGCGLAMRDLGRCYQFGEGCMGNMKTAVEWYEKALEVLDDPELAQKTALFRMMGENDPNWGEDYASTDDGDDDALVGGFDAGENEAPGTFAQPDLAFPKAEPGEDQHPHLDFLRQTSGVLSLLGAAVNQTGTEYAFESLREESSFNEPIRSVVERAAALDRGSYPTAGRAREMAELFRVELAYFDPGEDREQQILNGLLRRCAMYNGLRSFAWTLMAYCETQGIAIADADVQTLRAVARFVEERQQLNYLADSYCPALCSGPDLHVFFLPDATSDADRKTILDVMNQDAEGVEKSAIASLDSLRAELDALHPAMETIYSALAATRDRRRELSGALADVLFAWCSMTYAARDPIFTEDGPINNFFEHPDQQNAWEEQWKKQREEDERQAAADWLKAHEKDLDRGAKIVFSGKKFVFDGSPDGEQRAVILEKLAEKGGIHRTGVSGQTDYLVCDPRRAGDSRIRAIQEQRAKGRCKDTKIVLAEEFYHALGYDLNPQEPESEPAPEPEQTAVPTVSDAAALDPALVLAYQEGRRCGDGHYTIGIPDGFILKENVGDRAFIAWSPDGTDEYDARIVLFDGSRSERSEEERKQISPKALCSVMEKAVYNGSIAQLFDEVGSIPLPEGCPDGLFGYAVDANRHAYHNNVYMVLGNAAKQLRIQINQVHQEDIPACDALAQNWLRTFQTDETPWETPSVDAPEFAGPLTEELGGRWAETQTASLSVLLNEYNQARDARVERFQTLAPKGQDSAEALKADLQALLDQTAAALGAHFERSLTVLERFAADAKNAQLLRPMLDSVGGALSGSDRISLTLDDETLETVIPDLQRQKDRFEALKKRLEKPEPQIEKDAEARLAAKQKEIEAEKKAREEAEQRERAERLMREHEARQKRQAEEARRQRKEEARRQQEEAARKTAETRRKQLACKREQARIGAELIGCSGKHVAAVRGDGTVVCAGDNRHGQCNVSGWTDIIAVHCGEGNTVGLTKDGRVRFAGWNNHGQSECEAWSDIRQVRVSEYCVLGLRADGTVVTTPADGHPESTAADVATWKQIVQIDRGGETSIGVDSGGHVHSVRRDSGGRAEKGAGDGAIDVIDGVVGGYITRCCTLKKDGVCSAFPPGQYQPEEIVKLFMLDNLPVALLTDGSLLLPETDRLAHVERFLAQHSGEKFLAISGDSVNCAILTDAGRVYVVTQSDSDPDLKTGEPLGAGFRLFESYEQLTRERAAQIEAARTARKQQEKQQREARKERNQQLKREATAAVQVKQTKQTKTGAKKDPKSIGSIFLAIGTLLMLISIIGACQPYRDTSGWFAPIIVGAVLFSIGWTMLKGSNGKK